VPGHLEQKNLFLLGLSLGTLCSSRAKEMLKKKKKAKENDGEGEFSYCKNFCKCHIVPPVVQQ
jgi:hypothetical protein